MEPLSVVKAHVALDSDPQLSKRPVVVEVDVLVLQRPPESLDVDVVQCAVHTVHADPDAVAFECSGESLRCGDAQGRRSRAHVFRSGAI